MAKILVVDDEVSVLNVLRIVLKGAGHQVETATNAKDAQSIFERENLDLVLQDLSLSGTTDSGIDLLKQFKAQRPGVPVLILTAHSNIESSFSTLSQGAFDFITKPFDNESIREVIARALAQREGARSMGAKTKNSTEILGNTPGMREILSMIKRVAKTDSTVLITGESGTGKELVARALHYCSERSDRPFVSVNSNAFQGTLLENELFGHVPGSYTGGDRNKKGLLEVADKGTFFFDEIGDIPPEMQAKLLRVLEEQEFLKVGGTKPVKVDLRFIGATNKNLFEEVEKGHFREDLFYRLNVIPIHLPPLRDRREDIELLASHFMVKFSEKMNRALTGISAEARDQLLSHHWPGNIRELQNAIERSVALSTGPVLDRVHLHLPKRPSKRSPAGAALQGGSVVTPTELAGLEDLPDNLAVRVAVPEAGMDLEDTVANLERAFIELALARTNGHLTNAAKLLGITFRSMRYKVQKLKIKTKVES